MNASDRITKTLFASAILALLAGCSHMGIYRDSEERYMAGDFKGASQVFLEDNDGAVPEGDSDGVLPNLYMGAADFMEGDFQTSITDFERAEAGMAIQEDYGFVKRMFAGYIGKGYDGAMANTYKAMAYLAQNDPDGARVEFNRAEEVSRKIAEKNKEAIDEKAAARAIASAEDENGDGKKKGSKPFDTEAIVEAITEAGENGDNRKMLEEFRHSVDELCGAGDYENPAVFFLDGILDLFWGEDADDREGAAFSFKKAYGLSDSPAALAGAEIAESVASGKIASDDMDGLVCVFFENGLGATKESNLHLFIVPIVYKGELTLVPVGLDLPKLVLRNQAYPNLVLRDGVDVLGSTLPLGSMDRLIAVEFRAEMPRIVLWQSVKALIQATISYTVARAIQEKNPLLGIAAMEGIALLASKNICPADLRHWNYLPKEFQAYFLHKPDSGKLILSAPGLTEPIGEVDLPQNGPALVYVKIPFAVAQAPDGTAVGPCRPIILVVGPGK